ncbi:hypothetical protein R6Z07F_018766 [Ovis aries]
MRIPPRPGGAAGWEHGPRPFATPRVTSRGAPASARLRAALPGGSDPSAPHGQLPGRALPAFLPGPPPTSDLRSPDIPQDWVSFLRSFGQLTLCPVNGTVTGKGRGSHIVGLLTTLNFGDGSDRNKTQTFQAQVQGSRMGLKGSSAGELVLITARVTTERTPGTCLYFSATPEILPSSQPPIPCSEEGAGNATLSPRMAEECVSVWSHEGLVLTKLLTSEELTLCGSRLLVLGFFLILFCGLCFPVLFSGVDQLLGP